MIIKHALKNRIERIILSEWYYQLFGKLRLGKIGPHTDFNLDDLPENLIVTFSNPGYSKLLVNWILHLQKLDLTSNILVFVSTLEQIEYLSSFNIKCLLWENPKFFKTSPLENIDYSGKYWRDITLPKLIMAYEVMSRGKNVLFSDADIVFLKNPFPYLINQQDGYDLAIQCDDKSTIPIHNLKDNCVEMLCSGFYYLKSTKASNDLFYLYHLGKLINIFNNDQVLLQKLLKYRSFKYNILNRDLFPNGTYWYENYRVIKEKAFIVHYNWLTNTNEKIEKMKIFNHWLAY
ncbi:MAG: hypothetical protein KAR19_18900 [Bacteroidales bacterium]|nr:hypothetical protein [Bacteroidales bacterium]